ncbi:MAG TPA: hypothetical protein VGO00_02075, partial [Kofleriaceae bacterium]|nr:hypothetical protein [Kofleriaceae bacterium]
MQLCAISTRSCSSSINSCFNNAEDTATAYAMPGPRSTGIEVGPTVASRPVGEQIALEPDKPIDVVDVIPKQWDRH